MNPSYKVAVDINQGIKVVFKRTLGMFRDHPYQTINYDLYSHFEEEGNF